MRNPWNSRTFTYACEPTEDTRIIFIQGPISEEKSDWLSCIHESEVLYGHGVRSLCHKMIFEWSLAVWVFFFLFQEADAIFGALSLDGRVTEDRHIILSRCRVRLPADTLILKISDELDPLIDFLPPSLCPACCVLVQRKPLSNGGDEVSNTIIVKSSSADLSNVPMQIALDAAQNAFVTNGQHMIVSQEMLQLGLGNTALRLTLPSLASVHRALRLGLPGCSIDYLPLPATPASLTVAVYPASLHLQNTHSPNLNPSEVAQWLSTAGNCRVVSSSFGCCMHVIHAEVASIDSWHRALALNGNMWKTQVMKVSTVNCLARHALTHKLSVQLSSRRMMLHWLRVLFGLGVVAKRLVLAFLGDPPIMVPHDVSTIEDALNGLNESRNVVIASGNYNLPHGLKIRSPVNLMGDGQVFLYLGSPLQIRSEFGAEFRNLHFLEADQMRDSGTSSTLISVQCSYLVAIGRGFRGYSDLTPVGGRPAFACCSWGRPSVTLRNCTIRGGHHAVDLRGGCGVRPRMGRNRLGSPVATGVAKHLDSGLDLGAWLERNRSQRLDHEELQPSIEFRGKLAFVPSWKQYVMTVVKLVDCEISNSETEAVNVWRGARLEMTRCWIHDCGQGISASHFETPRDLEVFEEFQVTPHISIQECLFEKISKNDWSSAISLGRFMTSGFTANHESQLTKPGFVPGHQQLPSLISMSLRYSIAEWVAAAYRPWQCMTKCCSSKSH